jgi:hypothetical protein
LPPRPLKELYHLALIGRDARPEVRLTATESKVPHAEVSKVLGGHLQQRTLDTCSLAIRIYEDGNDAAVLLAVSAKGDQAAELSIDLRYLVMLGLRIDRGIEAFREEWPCITERCLPEPEGSCSVCAWFIGAHLDAHAPTVAVPRVVHQQQFAARRSVRILVPEPLPPKWVDREVLRC